MGIRWAKCAVALLTLMVALAGGAPIAGAAGERDTGGFGAFNLKASHGYRLFVFASSEAEYRHGHVVIWVTRKSDSVFYVAPAEVTEATIDADLGELGRIALEFEPSGNLERTAPVCHPNSTGTFDGGHYIGSFEFHGEEGFTDVSVGRARFDLHPLIDFVCGGAGSGEAFGRGIRGARLTARGLWGKAKVALKALQNRPGARVNVEASLWEKRGRIGIQRSIERTYGARAFRFDPQLRTAALRPPTPFAGAAVFRRDAARDSRWRGTLGVDFPGRSDVPLTGPSIHAFLIHASRVREGAFHPDPRDRPNLPPSPSTKLLPIASATSSLLGPN